jgi:hypothetical protein
MLLAYVDDLLQRGERLESLSDAYERIVTAWIQREETLVGDRLALRSFSERLALAIYLNREEWGGERISLEHINALAQQEGITLESWQLTGRSLLNRGAAGIYKFAHRSILDYLFTQALEIDERAYGVPWTKLMVQFVSERCLASGSIHPIIVRMPLARTRDEFANQFANAIAVFSHLCTSKDSRAPNLLHSLGANLLHQGREKPSTVALVTVSPERHDSKGRQEQYPALKFRAKEFMIFLEGEFPHVSEDPDVITADLALYPSLLNVPVRVMESYRRNPYSGMFLPSTELRKEWYTFTSDLGFARGVQHFLIVSAGDQEAEIVWKVFCALTQLGDIPFAPITAGHPALNILPQIDFRAAGFDDLDEVLDN